MKPHEAARKRALDALARGEQLRAVGAGFATSAADAAVAGQDKITKALPKLAKAALSATNDDQQQDAQRSYLQAIHDRHRLEQGYQLARRQQGMCGAEDS